MTFPAKDYTGMERGRLKAIEYAGYSEHRCRVWKFECSCGNYCEYKACDVFANNSRPRIVSCGCKKRDNLATINASGRNINNRFYAGHPVFQLKQWLTQLRLPDGRFAPKGYVSKRTFTFD